MKQRPLILKNVEKLLSEFESTKDYSKKYDTFNKAMIIFKKYLSDSSPSSDDIDWIKRIKISYTRVFLEQLPYIPPDQGLNFLFLLILYVSEEIKTVILQSPSLGTNYNTFLEYYKDDLIGVLERLHPN